MIRARQHTTDSRVQLAVSLTEEWKCEASYLIRARQHTTDSRVQLAVSLRMEVRGKLFDPSTSAYNGQQSATSSVLDFFKTKRNIRMLRRYIYIYIYIYTYVCVYINIRCVLF